jgi:cell division GTPase FtsZ
LSKKDDVRENISGSSHDNQSQYSKSFRALPLITVFGVEAAGGNAVNNMIESRLEGVESLCHGCTGATAFGIAPGANGTALTQGLGAGHNRKLAAAAEEALPEILIILPAPTWPSLRRAWAAALARGRP